MEPVDKAARQRVVNLALGLAKDTPLEPDAYELSLLAAYVEGTLSLEQLVADTDQHRGKLRR